MAYPLLETQNLSVTIGKTLICSNLNLSISPKQCWGILGLNGIGKTTLLYTLAGLKPAEQGNIFLNGSPLAQLSKQKMALIRGMLFQNNIDYFPSTVFETALTGRHPHVEKWQWESALDKEITSDVLHEVGLAEMEQRFTDELSAGERQRLAIATLLIQDPQLYLLDEPTSHLDLHHQISVLDLLTRRVKERNKAMVIALHDINLAARYCDHLILMYGPQKILQGPTEKILNLSNLRELYQRSFLCAKVNEQDQVFYVT